MLKGTVDGAIVSLCTILRGKRQRLCHRGTFGLSVARSHWSLGVGKAMCLAMLDTARQVGVTRVELRVREDNGRDIRLYESVGFVKAGVAPRAFRLGDRSFGDVLMGMSVEG